MRQHLIFDADDTLWENNRYFEEAFAEFVSFIAHDTISGDEIQAILDEIQQTNRHTHGYGARSFAASLRETFRHVMETTDDDPRLDRAEAFGLRILDLEMEPIAGVEETLAALRPHHDLLLLTKGHPEEQRAKIDRSGIAHHFDDAIVVTEKTAETYRETLATRAYDPAKTWMIGNSPRSDINPALAAGINAVFIPHPRTWHLEVEELQHLPEHHPGALLQLAAFPELLGHFLPGEVG
jgi:putative hydrolase of the HAD superfamily